jgi:hypothetical protein
LIAEDAMGVMDNMDEEEFADYLTEALDAFAEENEEEPPRIDTFEQAGLLTSNVGLVLRYGDAEFQLTIVRRA